MSISDAIIPAEKHKQDDFVSRKIPINEGELEQYLLAVLKKAEENVQNSKLQKMLDEKARFDKVVIRASDVKESEVTFVLEIKDGERKDVFSSNFKRNVVSTDFQKGVDYIIICPLCARTIFSYNESTGYYSYDKNETNSYSNCPSCKRKIKPVFLTYFETHDPNSEWTKRLNKLKEEKPNDLEIIREAIKSVKADLPPCGILNCNGGCDDFRHIVEPKPENALVAKRSSFFSSLFQIFKSFFSEVK